ncbi:MULTISPECIES: endonuclease/exonuclease/phosphatase family protein [Anaerolinea]|uniref:Endonuclease/exonuclease/phosphatase domain-containing protein n=1 Tax=Anaerolinea thermophila (strain DSM 14523 / JCM 11388 / NBRC 100420 / UNI-1) TaxID=926569 RepID=E8MYF2_ANATU|nr:MULTISPECIES: endonuclease/exonuclease/phosphatase family protein [Anaerolinea]BAJ62097.1 hypothetical protein ANT_00630 [Anaerolinea thermophila UNI-1]
MEHPLTLVTFNLRTAEAQDGEFSWARRRDMVVECLRDLDADLIGLQEVHDDSQARDVRSAFPEYEWIGVRRGGNGAAPLEMNVALVRRGAFEVLEQQFFWLSRTPEVPGSISWGSAYVCTAIFLRLRSCRNGAEAAWFNTHLDYLPQARLEGAKLLRRRIEALPPDCNVLVTGDFNAGKRSCVYRTLLGEGASCHRLRDAYRAVHTDGRGEGTFHAFGMLPRPQAIDWVLVSKDLPVEDAGVACVSVGGVYPSDHYPVWAKVRL